MGDPNDPAVLLIMGLGAQFLLWRKGFCEKLIDQGLRVIRYDNRDVGLSSKFEGHHTGAPLLPRMLRSFFGKPSPAVYTLEHMADDAAALFDHLHIEKAHIVGCSMGGMIAQIFAARYRHRTKTLAVIFSSNNQPVLPPPAPSIAGHRSGRRMPPARRSSTTRSASPRSSAARATRRLRSGSSPTRRGVRPRLLPRWRGKALRRDHGQRQPAGYDGEITAPTVVIHGRADKLMRPSGGRAIAKRSWRPPGALRQDGP